MLLSQVHTRVTQAEVAYLSGDRNRNGPGDVSIHVLSLQIDHGVPDVSAFCADSAPKRTSEEVFRFGCLSVPIVLEYRQTHEDTRCKDCRELHTDAQGSSYNTGRRAARRRLRVSSHGQQPCGDAPQNREPQQPIIVAYSLASDELTFLASVSCG